MHITSISGSPSQRSRSTWLLQLAQTRLEGSAEAPDFISVRDLPAGVALAIVAYLIMRIEKRMAVKTVAEGGAA